jgi:peptidoglycan hydrolase CwlO-like protein
MKICVFLTVLVFSSTSLANDYGYLKKEDQTYFKNDSFEGNNKWERIDLNVKEINKLHGEIASMKAEIEKLKQEVEILKNKK